MQIALTILSFNKRSASLKVAKKHCSKNKSFGLLNVIIFGNIIVISNDTGRKRKLKETHADLILHPVRMQIITNLLGQQLTPQQLAERMDKVPQATLYRQLNKLAKEGVIYVAEERPVRGTVEKVYAVNPPSVALGPGDLAKASREDLMRYFTNFVISLLADFAAYSRQPHPDMLRDGAGFSQVSLYLNDDELRQMSVALSQLLLPYIANQPTADRRRRVFTTILIPSPEENSSIKPENHTDNQS